MSDENTVQELSEDIELVGPGQMLAEAREELGLSQEQVATKLNFRTTLVQGIENDTFDKSLPATFNKGYLRNYAKLVGISPEEVLSCYETLNIAEKQCAEMQSFSKGTQKQAENNRLMWGSYLIVTLLIISTIVWWFQNQAIAPISALFTDNAAAVNKIDIVEQPIVQLIKQESQPQASVQETIPASFVDEPATVSLAETLIDNTNELDPIVNQEQVEDEEKSNDLLGESTTLIKQEVPVVFTFSGDCWVNIFDATGERIAWGMKKSGYVMSISGQAPFNITLGKPELVAIDFNGAAIDMSQFNRGNIAKFSLPIQ
jgi:cytoskeleton protein RodZ